MQRGPTALSILKNQWILDLTLYEVGNALWRMYTLQRKLDRDEILDFLNLTMQLTTRVSIIPVSEISLLAVMEVAAEKKITFYDAAYVTASKGKKLTLVTDDAHLAEIASDYIQIKKSRDL